MTFAQFVLEIRRRATALPDDARRPVAIEQIARDVLASVPEGEESGQVRRMLAAFLGLGDGEDFDATLLDRMTPELVFRLDMIVSELVDFGRTIEAVRALRGALIRPIS